MDLSVVDPGGYKYFVFSSNPINVTDSEFLLDKKMLKYIMFIIMI